ncbi:hypothetical protein AAE478_004919 [Parahypoxylon ruwenzoriense]
MSAAPPDPHTAQAPNRRRHRERSRRTSKPNKRRSTQRAGPADDEWFTIRDIIDEKVERGKVYYLVDWEGIDRDGQPYQPSWEPKTNVTPKAVEDWRAKKAATKDRPVVSNTAIHDTGVSVQEPTRQSNRVQPSSSGRRSLDKKRLSERGAAQEEPGLEKKSPHKRRRTNNHSESSGSADRDPHPDRDTSQSSGRLRDVIAGDYIPPGEEGALGPRKTRIKIKLRRAPSPSQQTGHARQISQISRTVRTNIAQREEIQADERRVIADSQEVSGIFSGLSTYEAQNSKPNPCDSARISQAQGEAVVTSQGPEYPRTDYSVYSSTEIPSRQPDHAALNVSGNWSHSGFLVETGSTSTELNSVDHRPRSRNATAGVTLEEATSRGNFSFSTYESLQFDFNAQASRASSSTPVPPPEPISDEHISAANASQDQPSLVPNSTASQQTHSQAAQVVQPLSSQHKGLVTQSQADFTVYDEDSIVPDSVTGQPQIQHDSQDSSQALSELDGNTRITSSALSDHESVLQPVSRRVEPSQSRSNKPVDNAEAEEPPPRQPTPPAVSSHPDDSPSRSQRQAALADMDSAQSGTPTSARERLQLIRARNFASLEDQSSTDSPPSNPTDRDQANSAQEEAPAESHADVQEERVAELIAPSVTSIPSAAPSTSSAFLDQAVEVTRNEQPSNEPQNEPTVEGISPVDAGLNVPGEEQPATLNPSDLTLSIEQDMDVSPSIPTDDALGASLPVPDGFVPREDDVTPYDYPKSLLPYVPTGPNEYLITIPLQSSSRPVYNDVLRDNETLIREYNASFLVSPHKTPHPATVWKLDEMFSRLLDICDLPPFMETIPAMLPAEVSKHVVSTNAKFSFVAELLVYLDEAGSDKKILILARPGHVMDLLGSVIEAKGCRYVRSGLEVVSSAAARHPLTVVLSSTVDKPSSIPEDVDVVIAFDHTYRQELLPLSVRERFPVVMALANTCSIQHLNMRVSENLESLERKNVLVLALVKAMRHVEDPDCSNRLYQVAELFARHIQVPDDDDFYWEPQSVPEDVFEDLHAASSQAQGTQPSFPGFVAEQLPGSRKRSHDDEDDETSSKRPKMSQPLVVTNVSHISDSLKSLIEDDYVNDSARRTLSISVSKLEALSAKITSLEAQLEESRQRGKQFRELSNRAQAEAGDYASTVNFVQTKYMVALKDRGTFEAECNEAKGEAKALTARLEASTKENGELKEKNAELRQKLAEAAESLLNSSNPELVKMVQLEKEIGESRSKISQLEKKVAIARNDMEYAQNAYQDASRKAVGLRAENVELEQRIDKLSRKADENIIEVNRIQSRNEVNELVRMLDEQKNIVRDRDSELQRLKDELRTLKNGRRETRQNSVPRSPRLGALGVMSPRNGGRVKGGSSSRGTSPAPPVGVYEGGTGTPAPSNRYSHLRDPRFQ